MDFYVSPVTLLFESSLISIAPLTPSQQLEIRTKMSENMSEKFNEKTKLEKRTLKLKKD
jgi:hypothetical protein